MVHGVGTEMDYPWTLLIEIPSDKYGWFNTGGHVPAELGDEVGGFSKGHPCPFCNELVKLPCHFKSWIELEDDKSIDYKVFVKHCLEKHQKDTFWCLSLGHVLITDCYTVRNCTQWCLRKSLDYCTMPINFVHLYLSKISQLPFCARLAGMITSATTIN